MSFNTIPSDNDNENSDNTNSINSFQNPKNLYKNNRENQEDYEFASNSYLITNNLFNYKLSKIDYNKVS